MEYKFTFFFFLKNTSELHFRSESILLSSSPDFEHFVLFSTLSASRIDLFWEIGFSQNENEARAVTLSSHRYSLKMSERLHEVQLLESYLFTNVLFSS